MPKVKGQAQGCHFCSLKLFLIKHHLGFCALVLMLKIVFQIKEPVGFVGLGGSSKGFVYVCIMHK
jgi:hypothetical protein